MKATLKLAPITEPKEGNKVVYKGSIATLKCAGAQNTDPNLKFASKTHSWFITDSCGHVWEIFNSTNNLKVLPELSQIVGEYEEDFKPNPNALFGEHIREVRAVLFPKKLTLPVSVDDWQYILDNNLIGKEVEMVKCHSASEPLNFFLKHAGKLDCQMKYPKQEKILYTEERFARYYKCLGGSSRK